MDIREARADDNLELRELQARCPQGTTLIVSTVNTPDFFARVKVYEDYKVYVACEDNRIIGSAACAVRDAVVSGKIAKVGHEFQLFVDPEYRGRRIAGQLHQVREEYLKHQGCALSYALIMEGNIPSMRYIARQGFKRHRTLVMPGIPVFKELEIKSKGKVRAIVPEDLDSVADLLNETWQSYELYEPVSADSLARLIERMPAYDYDNIFVLEGDGKILSCLGFWDWSQVMQITVEALSLKMRAIGLLIDVVGRFRPIPRGPKPGDRLRQMVLTPIGFKNTAYLAVLLRYVNNQALLKGIQQMFYLCEKDDPLLSILKGFIHIDTSMHLYLKPLQENVSISQRPVFINALDL